MERHKCKLCTRSFSNGRALGGHMKAHLAAHPLPLPPKLTQQQLSDGTTESASSSSSGEELEMKIKSQSPDVAEEKSLGYGLRNNPKKSFRFADPEFSFAVDSGSVVVVQDRESETESRNPTRRRSKRNRKLFTTHQDHHQKPSCLQETSSPAEPEAVSSVSDTSPEGDVAMCLMMLSRDVWMRNNDEEEEVQDQKKVGTVEESQEIKLIHGKHHRCDKCKKEFRSYHAFGVHKKVCGIAAETKNADKVVSTGDKIFQCKFCFKVFGSGQALGGHKRSHLLANSSTSTVAVAVAVAVAHEHENNLIDLNLPAPLEEDAFSVVSDA